MMRSGREQRSKGKEKWRLLEYGRHDVLFLADDGIDWKATEPFDFVHSRKMPVSTQSPDRKGPLDDSRVLGVSVYP